jgi:probable phosphoglycerate mutase
MSTGPPRAVLVRHAETEWSLSGQHTGLTDLPLTEHGREVARTLAQPLSGWSFQRVLVSPSLRARETCELAGLGVSAEVRDELHEWDYGDYEGLTSAQIEAIDPDWDLWRDGCPGGESPAEVGARLDAIVAELAAADGPVAVFSHGHALRVLGVRWIELAPAHGRHLGLSTASVSMLGHERQTPVLARWNDTVG